MWDLFTYKYNTIRTVHFLSILLSYGSYIFHFWNMTDINIIQ